MSFPPNSEPPGGTARRGFVLGPDDGDGYWWLGSTSIVKLAATSSRGSVDVVDHRVPAGYAPPPHVHSESDEIFYLIDGELAVTCGDDHWQAGPGSLVFLPRLVPHGFVVSDAGPARTLLINVPAGFADVITELGQATGDLTLPASDVPVPGPDRVASVSKAHGINPP